MIQYDLFFVATHPLVLNIEFKSAPGCFQYFIDISGFLAKKKKKNTLCDKTGILAESLIFSILAQFKFTDKYLGHFSRRIVYLNLCTRSSPHKHSQSFAL